MSCWPTLVVVSPTMKALTMYEGEGNKDALFAFVAAALEFYDERRLLFNREPLPVVVASPKEEEEEDVVDSSASTTTKTLRFAFPGKIAVSGRRLAVADSANHRIVVGVLEEEAEGEEEEGGEEQERFYCVIEHVIGGPSPGCRDGEFGSSSSSPSFRFPQGLAWWDDEGEEKLIVADTENHLIRVVSLPHGDKPGKVDTIVGKPGGYVRALAGV